MFSRDDVPILLEVDILSRWTMFGLTWNADTFSAKVYIDGGLVEEEVQNDDPDTILLSVKNTTSNSFFKKNMWTCIIVLPFKV